MICTGGGEEWPPAARGPQEAGKKQELEEISGREHHGSSKGIGLPEIQEPCHIRESVYGRERDSTEAFVIEHVENFKPELKRLIFRESSGALGKRHVRIDESLGAQRIPSLIRENTRICRIRDELRIGRAQ